MAHWIGLVNGFSNPVSKINKVEIYILNGSVKGKIYPWSYIYDHRSKGVKVGLRVLMAMRDGGVAFQAEKKMEVGTDKTGRWGSKRAKSMRDGGVAD